MASYVPYRFSSLSHFVRSQDWNSSYARYEMSKVPIIGDAYKAMDQTKYYSDYLKNHGMTWDDVKYPALLGGEGAFGAGASVFRVSKNIMRLYR